MFATTKYFVNRNSEIETLSSVLNSKGPEKNFLVLMYGSLGIGKTELLYNYLLQVSDNSDIRIAYVDLHDRDYLGLISEIVKGLGKSGFEDLEKTYDAILFGYQAGIDQFASEHNQNQLRALRNVQNPEQKVGMTFLGPVTGEDMTFINGPVTIANPKVKNIININLKEPKKVEELNHEKIALAFQNCLSDLSKKQTIVLLLDHWESVNDPLKIWLETHLLTWIFQSKLKKALVVLSRERFPVELKNKGRILPLEISRFSHESALEFWVKNELPTEEFDILTEEIYGLPSALALEVGMLRFRRAFQVARDKGAHLRDSKNTIYDLVLEFLEILPEPLKMLVRLSSIPNVFTPKLIQQMTGDESGVTDALENLHQYYFINKGEDDWYYYSPNVREVIRAFWKQHQQVQDFQKANHIAITYFEDFANKTVPPESYFFQREVLYHRLLEDEEAGLTYIADLFERACDQRQIGAAQSFSIQLIQTLPQLSPLAREYASYYEMRLDFLLNRREKLEQKLGRMIDETSDPLLKGRAGILLGQVWLVRYEWKKSANMLKDSLEILEKLEVWPYAARATLALGDLYLDLVENSGGVQFESSNDLSKLSQFLTRIVFLPFLLLDWLRRKIWFLPGWFYFGGNYQEWILNYLLQMSGTWYRKARRMAQIVEDDATSLNAFLGEANVAIQQRREAKAQRIYSRLAQLPTVRSSRYRLAQVLYGQGQVSMLAKRGTQANQELQSALNIFRSFVDEVNIALVARAWGTTNLQLGDHEVAARAFLESFRACKETQDTVLQTQVSWELEQLIEKKQTNNLTEQQIEETLSGVQEKQYVARFPSDLLRRFRALAYGVALPLSYLLILFVGTAASLSLIFIEDSALQVSSTGRLSQSDILALLIIGILPIFLTFWIIELVYAMVGQAWVFMAGRNSLNSLGEQPDRIVLTSEEVLVDSPGLHEPIRIAWNEIQKLVLADYKLWQRPIYLLSRQGIVSSSKSIIIDGITSGYMQIRKELIQRMGASVNQLNADTVILTHPTTYIAVFFAMLHAQFLVSLDIIEITAENLDTGMVIPLFLSPLLVFFIVNIFMIFPPLILWRVNLQRRFFSQQLGKRPRWLLNLYSFGIAIVLTILAILWLIFSPFL